MGRGLRGAGALACVVGTLSSASAWAAAPALRIDTLSNRADLISGDDALVAITPPKGISPDAIRVRVGKRDVTSAFAQRADGQFEGLVTDLPLGSSSVTARAPGARTAALTITNHPIGGPIFSGPQLTPWLCQPHASDRQCNAAPRFSFVYLPAGLNGLQPNLPGGLGTASFFRPYDPASPPSPGSIARTRTDNGVSVPYIVRIETGYEDRDQYQIAVLYRPGTPWKPWAPQSQFDHKLLITHGSGCGADRSSVPAPAVTEDNALARGFAILSTALDNAGHNCNIVTQAESLVMAKEHFAETYGSLRYTIGTGCSGGSLTMQQVANAYPGIYQGLLPQCSFPDAWTTIQQSEDSVLLRAYLEDSARWAPGVVWTPTQVAAVEGHPNPANAIELDLIFGPLLNPSASCNGVAPGARFDRQNNPTGARCSLADYMINVFGPRKDGYAGRPYDNVGVQYGLQALRDNAISPAAFVDLNVKAGSHDINFVPQKARAAADSPALAYSYRSGAVNEANGLRDVAIIDLRGSDPGLVHDAYRSFAIRDRLDRANGTHANQVIWEGPIPLVGDVNFVAGGLDAMDRWLAAVESDHSGASLARRIIESRPAGVTDRCTSGLALDLPGAGFCKLIDPTFSTPRVVAGSPLSTDITKCALSPLSRGSYGPVAFTDAQWDQLREAFPEGVCDFSRAGIDQQPTQGWLDYSGGPGGKPLPAAPLSQASKKPKTSTKRKKHAQAH